MQYPARRSAAPRLGFGRPRSAGTWPFLHAIVTG